MTNRSPSWFPVKARRNAGLQENLLRPPLELRFDQAGRGVFFLNTAARTGNHDRIIYLWPSVIESDCRVFAAQVKLLPVHFKWDEDMFGNPDWFSLGKSTWVLVPTDRRGWSFLAIWTGTIIVPFLLLWMMQLGFPEGLLWLGLSSGMFAFDYAKTCRCKREQIELQNLHFIGDEEQPVVHTENYELNIKK